MVDVIRNRISEYQAVPSKCEADVLHTFYIFFLLDKKVNGLLQIVDELCDRLGVRMGVDSDYFRQSLWQLYENDYPGYVVFQIHSLSAGKAQLFVQTKYMFIKYNNI